MKFSSSFLTHTYLKQASRYTAYLFLIVFLGMSFQNVSAEAWRIERPGAAIQDPPFNYGSSAYDACKRNEFDFNNPQGIVTHVLVGTQNFQVTNTELFPFGLPNHVGCLFDRFAFGDQVADDLGAGLAVLLCQGDEHYDIASNTCSICSDPSTKYNYDTQQCEIPSIEHEPRVDNNCGVGNPCNVATGEKLESHTDYDDGWLMFTRQYHSIVHTHEPRMGNFMGSGWTHNFSDHMAMDPTGRVLGWIRGDGYHEPMIEDAANPGEFITDSASKLDSKIITNANGTYTLRRGSSRDIFNATGRLAQRIMDGGHTLSLQYNTNNLLQSVQDETGRTLGFTYDDDGKLQSVTRPDNREIRYEYDDNDNLEFVRYTDGTHIQYHYENSDFPHHLTGITDETGNRSHYSYHAVTGRTHVSTPVGGVKPYTFEYNTHANNQFNQTTVTDASGDITQYNFIAGNRHIQSIVKVCDGSSQRCTEDSTITNTWDTDKLLQTDDDDLVTQYGGHDELDRHTYMIESYGSNEARRTDLVYDPRFTEKITEQIAHSVVNSNSANTSTDLSSACDPATDLCNITTSTYNDDGNMTSRTISGYQQDGTAIAPRTTTWTYDGPYGQLSRIDGPRTDIDDITEFTYYADEPAEGTNRGRLKRVTLANGLIQRDSIQYNALGNITSEIGLNDEVRQYSYYSGNMGNDRLQSLTISKDNASQTTYFTYIPTGEIASITTAHGTSEAQTTSFTYDAAKQLIRIADNLGNYMSYSYDSEGNQTSESLHDDAGELQRSLSQTYDRFNRLDATTQDFGNSNSDFAADGTLAQMTDGKGSITDYSYDTLRRLTGMVEDMGQLDIQTTYVYDVADRLVSITDPNDHETTYHYDDLGNLRQLHSPDTGISTYTYDAAGNRIAGTNARGINVSYTYDALNRITQITYPDSTQNVTYTYDDNPAAAINCGNGKGRLCSVSDASGSMYYAYDYLGNATVMQVTYDGQTYTTEASYNTNSIRTSLTTPAGTPLSYQLDGLQRISGIQSGDTALLSNVAFRADNQVSAQTFANGFEESITFDTNSGLPINTSFSESTASTLVPMLPLWALFALVAIIGFFLGKHNTAKASALLLICLITTTFATPTGTESFSYDLNGNIDTRGFNGNQQDFEYDAINRLITESGDIAQDNYAYDANGNRTFFNNVNYNIDPNSNRLTQIGNTALGYDAMGNLTDDGNTLYTYDDADRLQQVRDANNQVIASYTYNHLNQRTKKVNHQTQATTYYHYDFEGLLLEETNAQGQSQVVYIYHNGIPVAVILKANGVYNSSNQDQTLSIISDHLGTPRLAMDENQQSVWTWEADAFGRQTANTDVDGDNTHIALNLRFPGQYYDEETGLHYNWNRYYNPQTGRYITSDPIGLEGGMNTYGYALQNSVNYADPYGKVPLRGQGTRSPGRTGNPLSGPFKAPPTRADRIANFIGKQLLKRGADAILAGSGRFIASPLGAAIGGILFAPGLNEGEFDGDELIPESNRNSFPDDEQDKSLGGLLPGFDSLNPVNNEILDIFCRDNIIAPNCQREGKMCR